MAKSEMVDKIPEVGPLAVIPVAPGLDIGADLGDSEAVLSLIRAREAAFGSPSDVFVHEEKHKKRLPVGVRNGETGWLENTWDGFVHSPWARGIALTLGVSMTAAVADACAKAMPPLFTETAPVQSKAPTETSTIAPTPSPTPEYRLDTGGPITEADLARMETADPLLKGRLDYFHAWYKWYTGEDPSVRPFSPDRPENLVFYPYTDQNGVAHWRPAWKFDEDYPGKILTPPAVTWGGLVPPSEGIEQGLLQISTSVAAGSDLAAMGMPPGAQLAAEKGTGDLVMVLNDQVVGRVDAKGVWQVEDLYPIDRAKLFNNMPKSYADLLASVQANDGKYVEAPDAITPEFLDWWKNKLLPVLGPEKDLPRNANMTIAGLDPRNDFRVDGDDLTQGPLLSQPEFFYFQHDGKVYPGLVLSTISHVGKDLGSKGTITVILTEDPLYGMGWDSLANLAAGKPVMSVVMFTVPNASFMPADCRAFMTAGLDGSAYWEPGVSTPEPSTPGKNTFWETGDHWYTPACGQIQTSIPR